MKRFLTLILLSLVVLLGIGGCGTPTSTISHTKQPQVIMRVLDPTLEPFASMWQAEIGRRFPDAVGVLVHGGDFVEGQWIVGDWTYRSDRHVRLATDVVKEAEAMYPGRTVVLLACNPGHLDLGIPGVYYAHSSVWCVPDRDTASVLPEIARQQILFGQRAKSEGKKELDRGRWVQDSDVIGNIFEFQSE